MKHLLACLAILVGLGCLAGCTSGGWSIQPGSGTSLATSDATNGPHDE